MSKRSRYSNNSQRSRETYEDDYDDVDPREKVKDCCRKFVAFMCTQIGVGALVVCYTLIGAVGFSKIESTYVNNISSLSVELNRRVFAEELWAIAKHHNMLNEPGFYNDTDEALRNFQNKFIGYIKDGYTETTAAEMWTFPAALMFSLSIITMIGYGNLVPMTGWGKFATVVYAIFGIPLYILYFMNMGEILAGCFRWVYTRLYECSRAQNGRKPTHRVLVPSTACLWVIGAYILTGTIMFAEWEQWSYLDSTYFCVTSLCKLGLGDFVPGAASKSGNESKLVINFIYMLLGLGLVAMCYNLMREDIRVKVKEMREDFSQCLEDTRVRFLDCCKRYRGKHADVRR